MTLTTPRPLAEESADYDPAAIEAELKGTTSKRIRIISASADASAAFAS